MAVFATIHQLNWTAPAEPRVLERATGYQVMVWHYAPHFMECVPIVQTGSGFASITVGTQAHQLPEASYLVVEQAVDIGMSRFEAAVRAAEVVGILELRFPQIVGRRVFEGLIQTPGSFVLMPEGVLQLVGRPGETPEEIETGLSAARRSTESLETPTRDRFRLAMRWYGRALDSINPVDRFLFLFTCLEIFPTPAGDSDVARAVTDFIRTRIAPTMVRGVVKERLRIGRIVEQRGKIVHDGLAYVDTMTDPSFRELLQRLEAITAVCMRGLAGLPLGTSVDAFLEQPAANGT
jgi:hypothetical protein